MVLNARHRCRRRRLLSLGVVAATKTSWLLPVTINKHGCCAAFIKSPTLLSCFSIQDSTTTDVLVRRIDVQRSTKITIHKALDDSDDDFLEELYKTVAEQDPEWFEGFVRNVLGDDEVPIRAQVPMQELSTRSEKQTVSSNDFEDLERNSFDLDLANVSVAPIEIRESKEVSRNENSDGTFVLSSATVDPIPTNVHQTDESIHITINKDESLDVSESETLREYGGHDNDLMVVYRDFSDNTLQFTPLPTLTRDLGYDKEEIPYIQADALDLIIRNGIRKPQRGVPKQWMISPSQYKILFNDVRIVPSDQVPVLLSAFDQASKLRKSYHVDHNNENFNDERTKEQNVNELPVERKESDSNAEATSDVGFLMSRDDEGEMFVSELPRIETSGQSFDTNPVYDTVSKSTNEKDESESIARNAGNNSDMVVIFMDCNTKKMQSVPLSSLQHLGYQTDDILSIHPDALTWIVLDEIKKPPVGIPSEWKQGLGRPTGKNDEVCIVPESEVWQKINRSQQAVEPRRNVVDENAVAKTQQTSSDAFPRSNQLESDASIAKDRDKRRERVSDSSRRNLERDEFSERSSKRIFNGRRGPTRSKDEAVRRGPSEPPSPKSSFWPDFSTFRELLRNEAEMRLRIVGDTWADAVKDEGNWRLGLYKEWLWTLHNGIGESIVPSQNERQRFRKNMSINSNIEPENQVSTNRRRQPRNPSNIRERRTDSSSPRSRREFNDQ